MLEEINYSARIRCDVCGRESEGSVKGFFLGEWAMVPMTKTRWKGSRFVGNVAVCGGCLHIRRFGEKLSASTYSMRDDILRKWAEMEMGDD